MKDGVGAVVLKLRPGGCRPLRIGQWLPRRRCWLRYVSGEAWWSCLWDMWRGLLHVGSGRAGSYTPASSHDDHWEVMMGLKRRESLTGGCAVRPALPADSKVLGKLPTLCEWLSATSYEDGTPRTPGYLWLSNRSVAYEVTLFDPDACAKLPCLGRTLDEALALAETHLRAEDAPWVLDPYMVARRDSAKKKKGA